jgi:hypothetical protein
MDAFSWRSGLPLALLAGLLAGCGAGDTHDQIMADQLAGIKELNVILEGVTDEASAKAAAPQVDAWVGRMKGLKQRSEALAPPSPEEERVLKEKYEPQMKELMASFGPNMMRIAFNPSLAAHLQKSLTEAGSQMKE